MSLFCIKQHIKVVWLMSELNFKWSRQIGLQGLRIQDNYILNQLREQYLKPESAITFQMDTKTESKEQRWLARILGNTYCYRHSNEKYQPATCMFTKNSTGPNKEAKQIGSRSISNHQYRKWEPMNIS